MMLEWLGLHEPAAWIETAVERTMQDRTLRTRDMGGAPPPL